MVYVPNSSTLKYQFVEPIIVIWSTHNCDWCIHKSILLYRDNI